MRAKDLRERSTEDLKELEKSLGGDSFQHRFKNFTNRLDDTSLIRKTRRDIARVKTLLAQSAKGTTPAAKTEAAAKPAKTKKAAAPKAAVKSADAAPKAAAGKKTTAKKTTADTVKKEAK
jgi:large subunit ribosomal protein L29